jgi:hypothetical protein
MEKADFEDNPFYFGSELGKHKFMDNVVRRFKNDRKHIEEKLLHMDK